jgi:hypothetical protein
LKIPEFRIPASPQVTEFLIVPNADNLASIPILVLVNIWYENVCDSAKEIDYLKIHLNS